MSSSNVRKPLTHENSNGNIAKQRYKAWIFLEGRVGDDNQLFDMLELIGWKYVTFKLDTSIKETLIHRFISTNLLSRRWKKIIEKQLPYPDAIFTIGGRSAAIAHAVKKKSGNKVKLFALGRPFAPYSWFDLIITTPQYCLPDSHNLVELPLPISLPRAADNSLGKWESIISQINKSKICVLIGGNNGNYNFKKNFIETLYETLINYAKLKDSVLLITNSARTPKGVSRYLSSKQDKNLFFYDINDKKVGNPYWMFIEISQEVLVTADSVSMISDAIKKNKIVRIIALRQTLWDKIIQKIYGSEYFNPYGTIRSCLFSLVKKGFLTPPRNIQTLLNNLIEKNMVTPFDGKRLQNHVDLNQKKYDHTNLVKRINETIRNKYDI